MLVKTQTNWLKNIVVLLILLLIPVIAFGTYQNEFRRLIILAVCYGFTYYAELHILIRYTAIVFHVFVIWGMETYFFREYLI